MSSAHNSPNQSTPDIPAFASPLLPTYMRVEQHHQWIGSYNNKDLSTIGTCCDNCWHSFVLKDSNGSLFAKKLEFIQNSWMLRKQRSFWTILFCLISSWNVIWLNWCVTQIAKIKYSMTYFCLSIKADSQIYSVSVAFKHTAMILSMPPTLSSLSLKGTGIHQFCQFHWCPKHHWWASAKSNQKLFKPSLHPKYLILTCCCNYIPKYWMHAILPLTFLPYWNKSCQRGK